MSSPIEDVDFRQAQQLGNRLLEQLDRLREAAPIYWSERQQAWIITGHTEVMDALRGNFPLSADRVPRVLSFLPEHERATRAPYAIQSLGRMLISLDAPEHTRMRKLMMRAFSKPVVETYRPYAREVIGQALSNAEAKGEFDFVEEVARYIPSSVILRLMGLSHDLLPRMRHWAWAVLSGFGGGGTTPEILGETEKVMLEMREAFLPEIEKRRANPVNDFISALVTAEENGEKLSEEEILSACYLALIAGHDTTGNSIALGTAAIASDRSAWELFRDSSNENEILNAVLELSRTTAMSTAMGRVVAADFEWAGHQFRKGQVVYCVIAAANRDPKVFADPRTTNLARPQNTSLVFGSGMHMCIGHLLAKMQLTEFFPALTRRFERVEILDSQLHWGTTIGFRGLQSLNVRVHPRSGGATARAAANS